MFPQKKHRKVQSRADFCKLNELTIHDSDPILCMDICFDSLDDSTVFSTMHASRGYCLVKVTNEDREKTNLASQHGLLCFTGMSSCQKAHPGRS